MLNRSWHAILDSEHNVVEVDISTWAQFFEHHDRTVAKTPINGLFVSTVFLGINHNFYSGLPLWFETMIFRDEDKATPVELEKMFSRWQEDFQWRYTTWQEAIEGHNRAVTIIKEGLF